MNEFGFWEKWGSGLKDADFAGALLALGSMAAMPTAESRRPKGESIGRLLTSHLDAAASKGSLVPWKFPKPAQKFRVGAESVALSALAPQQVADAWPAAACRSSHGIRFEIRDSPAGDELAAWFRLLFEATPPPAAAHFDFDNPQAGLHFGWPLRFGYLPGNEAREAVKTAGTSWPSDRLSEAVQLDRDRANCDVLLFVGSADALLRRLLDSPAPLKANLIFVIQAFDDEPDKIVRRLQALTAETRASGLAYLRPPRTASELPLALNRFVENLSHNQPLDVALCEAFTRRYPRPPLVFLTKGLANHQIRRTLDKLSERLVVLADVAPSPIREAVLGKMNLPPLPAGERALRSDRIASHLKKHRDLIRFDHEGSGATGMAELRDTVEMTEARAEEVPKARRFLQERVLVRRDGRFVEQNDAFWSGVPTLVRVMVGPPDSGWAKLEDAFPEDKLPKDRDEWRLKVVLTEPNHLPKPLWGTLKLPRLGPSTECEFLFKPGGFPVFEGRITVLHRGRVLQTGVLRGPVVDPDARIPSGSRIEFTDKIAVRTKNLEDRRQFDLALIQNHTEEGRPRLTAIAADHAWCFALDGCRQMAADINAALSSVANSVQDYEDGWQADANRELLIKLARLGFRLQVEIVRGQIQTPGNSPDIPAREYIQIVSTKGDKIMPFEFIYEDKPPLDDARVCLDWTSLSGDISCRAGCVKDRNEWICPLAFWGVGKVIERHDVTPELNREGKDFFLQSEPAVGRATLTVSGTAVVGTSSKVEGEDINRILAACRTWLGAPAQKARNWADWQTLVGTHKPHFLLALPHADGDRNTANLEIGNPALQTILIGEDHIKPAGSEYFPLVALLGCDTVGTSLDYGSHVRWFQQMGAAVVIGTMATVYTRHAAKVAEALIRGLTEAPGPSDRLGEVIRSLKREALRQGQLMPLCVVAYGDADWKLG